MAQPYEPIHDDYHFSVRYNNLITFIVYATLCVEYTDGDETPVAVFDPDQCEVHLYVGHTGIFSIDELPVRWDDLSLSAQELIQEYGATTAGDVFDILDEEAKISRGLGRYGH